MKFSFRIGLKLGVHFLNRVIIAMFNISFVGEGERWSGVFSVEQNYDAQHPWKTLYQLVALCWYFYISLVILHVLKGLLGLTRRCWLPILVEIASKPDIYTVLGVYFGILPIHMPLHFVFMV